MTATRVNIFTRRHCMLSLGSGDNQNNRSLVLTSAAALATYSASMSITLRNRLRLTPRTLRVKMCRGKKEQRARNQQAL